MAFKRKQDIGGGDQFKFETIGSKLTGYYLGSFDFDGEYGPTKKHVFKTPKGLKVVFGQTHLTQLLGDERPGVLMQITYTEDKKMKKGNPMKVYTLDIDDEQKLDASEIPSDLEETQEPEDDEPTEEDDAVPMDEVKVDSAKRAVPSAARVATSDSKKRIDDILIKRRQTAS